MARIACLGSALQDIYLIDRDDFVSSTIGDISIFGQIAIGSKVDIDQIAYEVGGGGTNSAVTFARTGHQSIFLGNIGRDSAGEAVLATLDREGVDNSYVNYVARRKTGCSIIMLDVKTGDRTILTYRGASADFSNLSPEDLALIHPDWLYSATLRGDLDTAEAFFKSAHQQGIKVAFNPGKQDFREIPRLTKILKYVDVVIMNKEEAGAIVTGKSLSELLARLANYVPVTIITDGSMGAIATDHQETYRLGLYEPTRPKDSTGAGDAFGSGFVSAIAHGKSFKDALIFASANSTSVVSHFGAKQGILTGKESLHPMPIQKIS